MDTITITREDFHKAINEEMSRAMGSDSAKENPFGASLFFMGGMAFALGVMHRLFGDIEDDETEEETHD